jgi:XTP/dITP diphosphohydrolase
MTTPVSVFLASGNAHKVEEMQALADDAALGLRLVSAREIGGMPPVEEDAGTFTGNARKKALALRRSLGDGHWVLADDSGLCVDALDGAPGVESAYFAGREGDGAKNLAKLLRLLEGVPAERRTAHFVCVLVLLDPGGREQVFEGRCEGTLLTEARGGAGFGYDPIFVPAGFRETFAQLGEDVKNRVSHRARAWAGLVQWWRGGGPGAPAG